MIKSKKMAIAIFALAPMVLASCGAKENHTSNAGTTGVMTVCIASKPGTIDPALNTTVDGGTYDEHLFEGLYRWSYTGSYPDGSVSLVPGLAKAAPVVVTNADGTLTYTYTLRDGLKWSDGTSLTAGDIARSWKRAVSKTVASDYNYLFEAIKGGADAEGEDDGASLQVSATNDTTLVVVLNNAISYWNELTAFPTFAPVPASADATGTWASPTNAATFVCNGPMKIKAYDATKIELEANPNYVGTVDVKAKDITFAFSDDSSAMVNSYKASSYDFIDDVPVSQIESLQKSNSGEFFNVGQLGTYYTCWNVNSTALNAKITTEANRTKFRHALALLINRQYIIDTAAKGGQIAANGFVSKGLTGANGVGDWTDTNGVNGDGKGYYDATSAGYAANVTTAIALLKECGFTYDEASGKFTDIPAVEYLFNTSDGHKAIGEAMQASYAKLGVTITLVNQDWSTFVDSRKAGSFTYARNGWLCDYNDPISMLDMWISTSGNDDVQLGKGDNATYAGYEADLNGDGTIADTEKNLTWANSYDVLIDTIKKTPDETLRFKLMHAAETELMSTWAICPIYYYTDIFMKKLGMDGYFAMPLGYKFFYGIGPSASTSSSK
jgi:ABC-type oligopeptide transport system substrate-binding subunit